MRGAPELRQWEWGGTALEPKEGFEPPRLGDGPGEMAIGNSWLGW
jgi:hypothetical protein